MERILSFPCVYRGAAFKGSTSGVVYPVIGQDSPDNDKVSALKLNLPHGGTVWAPLNGLKPFVRWRN